MVIIRRIKKEPDMVDKIKAVVADSERLYGAGGNGEDCVPVACRRKPSERFERRAISAKSRASTSERMRVANLVEKLRENGPIETVNEQTIFDGYKPGHEDEGPPG